MDPFNTQPNQPAQGLINQNQKMDLAQAGNVSALPLDQQTQKVNEMAGVVLKRVFSRIVQVLTNADMEMIKSLDVEDNKGNAVKYFLMTKVPNLEYIIQEEIDMYKKELVNNPLKS